MRAMHKRVPRNMPYMQRPPEVHGELAAQPILHKAILRKLQLRWCA
jgi:hypothetical protein